MNPNESDLSKNSNEIQLEVKILDEGTRKRISSHFKGPLAAYYQIGPEKWIMPKNYPELVDKLHKFSARSDDIYISTYPRSGTTWTQEMMWLLCNDLNYDAAKATHRGIRFPFLEISTFMSTLHGLLVGSDGNPVYASAFEVLSEMTAPRLIKTHLPIKLIPKDALDKHCKIVYVARNPKDVIVSLFHFVCNPLYMYEGNFEQLLDFFMDDLLVWGSYFEHIKDGWSRRNDSNVLFLFYEDLVMDLKSSLKKLAAFLGHRLNDDDLPVMMDYLNIKNFKQNDSTNQKFMEKYGTGKWEHIRSGQIGGNPEMTAEYIKKIDEWTDAQLQGTGLKFPHQQRHKIEMYRPNESKQIEK